MRTSLDLYLITARNKRCVLFSPPDILAEFEKESDDRIMKSIAWVRQRPNRLVAWFGRVLQKGHKCYLKLEDRIAPGERVLKTMASAGHFVVFYGASRDSVKAAESFRVVLRRERFKHQFWFILDLAISAVALIFTPFLVPIPGPNLFLYVPLLRTLSHFRALRGSGSGLRSVEVEFKYLPELIGLEENLGTPSFDRRAMLTLAETLNIRGLEQFLERMV